MTKVGISSFLVTLSMLLIVRGAALYVTQGFPLGSWTQPGLFVTLPAGSFELGPFRLYTSLWRFIALTLLAAYVLNYAPERSVSGGQARGAHAPGRAGILLVQARSTQA